MRALLSLLCLAPIAGAQGVSLHYRLDSSSGMRAWDTSGNDHHGGLQGSYAWGIPGAVSGSATSVGLDGVSATAGIPHDSSLDDLRAGFTVLAWIKPNSTGGRQRVLSNPSSWGFGIDNGSVHFSNFGLDELSSGVSVPTQTWSHIAAVVSSTSIVTFYIDGAPWISLAASQAAGTPGPMWWLGSKDGASDFLDGALDDVQVYPRALSHAEIDFVHQNGGAPLVESTSFCNAQPNSTGVAASMSAAGSGSLSANLLSLRVESMPDQTGVVFFGASQTQVPFGNGVRCVARPWFRLPAAQAQGGVLTTTVDLSVDPGAEQIAPGSRWSFQTWYLDPAAGGAGFNLSDGVELTFLP